MRIAILLMALFATTAEAQDRPRPEVRATGGFTGFLDEDSFAEALFGGSVRYSLTPRVGIEPEFLYMIGAGSVRDLTVIPHLSYDFRPGLPVRPYLIGGVGVLYHRSDFFTERGIIKFRDTELTVSGGVGVKVFVTPRIFVAPEFRLGFETIYRATGSIGFVF